MVTSACLSKLHFNEVFATGDNLQTDMKKKRKKKEEEEEEEEGEKTILRTSVDLWFHSDNLTPRNSTSIGMKWKMVTSISTLWSEKNGGKLNCLMWGLGMCIIFGPHMGEGYQEVEGWR